MKIVIDDKIPFIRGAFEQVADVAYIPDAKIAPADVADADALIVRTRTKCAATLLDGSNVKFIATATIGYDHIDSAYCENSGITWTSAPGCNSFSVQQYIASALLRIAESEGIKLAGKTLGVVGVGNVGTKVAKLAEIIGMRVLLNDPPRKSRGERPETDDSFVPLDRIRKEADFITFHVPMIKDGHLKTFHMADAEFLSGMKGNAWLINSSRGPVVDNQTLKKALESAEIAGAVLDVWENEPDIDTELLNLARFATPHIAGYSADGKANGAMMSVRAVSHFFDFGLDDWSPSNIPLPDNRAIDLDCDGMEFEDISRAAILATYDIAEDDARLRSEPASFERLRGDYPLRREPPAYLARLKNDSANFAEKLSELRFDLA
ncbi:MAG: 4-phosphoerythronate dehydrogenase PdxB [Kiritimatiellaeota bacterium]|nr:4-phosphoerythronate dehydrogenase PdxB [Kiritimatiellota bacterium]